ncbi:MULTISPECIES: DnaD domain protein [unclassified Enterococcus]|jgi:DNA replication protein|uniref:DnaD domain-containing protein n=1 Tax=unclassified Enterococcus TaxID=2608891 RepID=UPI000428549C
MLSLESYLASGQTVISNLFLKHYRHIGLDSDSCLFILQLNMAQQQGDDFPDLQMIAMNMGLRADQIYQLLNQLVSNGFLFIETTTVSGKKADKYDLSPIYERLAQYLKNQTQKIEEQSQEQAIQSVYQLFEQEFGRPLSAIEFQRIGQWLEEDHYHPDLLKLALREAVLNQAYSFNYVDRILLSWERKNITTKQQVEEEQKRRKNQLLQKEAETAAEPELPNISLKNWLEDQ